MPDGFAFAMDCNGAKTVITFRFAKDLVSQTIETLITGYKGGFLVHSHHDAARR